MDISNMGKKLLSAVEKPDKVDGGVLVAMDYAYAAQRDIEIKIDQPDFTSGCPRSGLPDFGSIAICYVPRQKIVELKSLKYYLVQYRNVGIFYEHVVNQILDDLVDVVKPRWMEITGNFAARGGITTQATAVYKGEKDVS